MSWHPFIDGALSWDEVSLTEYLANNNPTESGDVESLKKEITDLHHRKSVFASLDSVVRLGFILHDLLCEDASLRRHHAGDRDALDYGCREHWSDYTKSVGQTSEALFGAQSQCLVISQTLHEFMDENQAEQLVKAFWNKMVVVDQPA